MSHANIITQVSQDGTGVGISTSQGEVDMGSLIRLNIRGELFEITRDNLMNLPESILLCLFPNGVFLDAEGNAITNLTEDDVVFVNFDPRCFEYIVNTFAEASSRLPSHVQHEVYGAYQMPDADVLNEKPAIIVLREDLDYYVIPPVKGISPDGIKALKRAAGEYLVGRSKVFEGLGYVSGKQLGAAEEHLLGMLCSSGFSTDSLWGHRSSEPGKTVLTSLALVNLKNPEPEPQVDEEMTDIPSPNLDPVQSNASTNTQKQSRRSRIAELATNAARSVSRSSSSSRRQKQNSAGTSSKLLLFWRKPARKCWWSDDEIVITLPNAVLGQEAVQVKLHIRRVWTLELSVIGVH